MPTRRSILPALSAMLLGLMPHLAPADPPPAGRDGIDVRALGADPTGQQNAAPAIQRALDQGGLIRIPPGRYKLTDTLRITRSSTYLVGADGSELFIPKGVFINGIVAETTEEEVWTKRDIRIRGITLRTHPENMLPGKNHHHTRGIWIDGWEDIVIENCQIENFDHENILLRTTRRAVVRGCVTRGARHGVAVEGYRKLGRWGCWYTSIENSQFIDAWDTGIAAALCVYYTQIRGNTIIRAACHGIDMWNISYAVVTDNLVHNWCTRETQDRPRVHGVGIFAHSLWGAIEGVPTRNIIIANNVLKHDAPQDDKTYPNGIFITGYVDAVTVKSNQIIGGRNGIRVSEVPPAPKGKTQRKPVPYIIPQNTIIEGNTVRGNWGHAMSLDGKGEMVALIRGNVFVLSESAEFYFGKDLTGLLIEDNLFRGGIIPEKLPPGYTWKNNTLLPAMKPLGEDIVLPDKTVRVINQGVPGANSAQGLARLGRAGQAKPDHTILFFGFNDAINSKKLIPVETYTKNLQAMIDQARTFTSGEIVLVTLSPIIADVVARRHPSHPQKDRLNEHLQTYNQAIRQLAEKNKLLLADFRKVVNDHGGAVKTKDSLVRNQFNGGPGDGLHLTARGNEKLAACIASVLRGRVKPAQTVLCVGDSVTFGPHLPGQGTDRGQTYPAWLWLDLNAELKLTDRTTPRPPLNEPAP